MLNFGQPRVDVAIALGIRRQFQARALRAWRISVKLLVLVDFFLAVFAADRQLIQAPALAG